MSTLETPDADAILSGESDWFDATTATTLSRHPLDAVETEFPHYVGSVDSADGVDRPSRRHPIFYGCFDWHSSVHSHWALIRQLRLVDDHPAATEIVESVDARITAEHAEREADRFREEPSFEKPYGWGWFLRLSAELSLWDDRRAEEWRTTLDPIEREIRSLVRSELLTRTRPFRVGTHGNTAFALTCVLDYARTVGDSDLASATADAATALFGDDRDYPVEYEPLGWDFLSPSLAEADLMRRVYDPDAFATWLDAFLPDLSASPYDAVLDPVAADPDPEEGVALHLVGLDVSKAWCLAGIADALDDHRYGEAFERSAATHAERGIARAFTEDYAGSHWLSSFVLYLLTRNEGGIAPA